VIGNLGLAAAAYNAGPRRVRDWIAGRGQLPRETRAYVRIITGRAAPKVESRISAEENANWGPWGLQLISDSSEQKALAEYKQLQKRYQSVLGDRAPLSRDSWGAVAHRHGTLCELQNLPNNEPTNFACAWHL
jgi:hypothetical protein